MNNVPDEVFHELISFLRLNDIKAFSCTSRAYHHFFRNNGTLHSDGRFARPLNMSELDGHCDLFTVSKERHPHLHFHPSGLSQLRIMPRHSLKIVLQCLMLANEKDAVLWIKHHNKLVNASFTNVYPHRLMLYRNMKWSFLIYSMVKDTLRRYAIKELRIHNLPILVEQGSLLLSSSKVLFLYLLTSSGSKCKSLILKGIKTTGINEAWSSEALLAAREHLFKYVDATASELRMLRLFSQRRFSTVTVNIGSCLCIVEPPLVHLEISNYAFNEIGRHGTDVKCLVQFLKKASFLKKIVLNNVQFIHGNDLYDIVEAFDHGVPNLEHVGFISIESKFIPTFDPHIVLFQLANRRLKKIHFEYIYLWDEFATLPLERLVADTTELQSLKIRKMYVDQSCLSPLFSKFENMIGLIELDLSYNALDNEFYGIIGRLLSSPSCMVLKRLILVGNLLSHLNIELLGMALSKNPSLIYLNLSDNFIALEGLLHLHCGLMENKHLQTIKLDKNSIRASFYDVSNLMEKLGNQVNSSLKVFSLKDNTIDQQQKEMRFKELKIFI